MYLVTICTKNFQCWFGDVVNGEIANKCWMEIPNHFDNVELDKFIIMPNHVHGIICIVESQNDYNAINVETRHAVSLPEQKNKFGPLKKGSLSTILGSYKSAVTRSIRKHHYPKFEWQPRFYDHVIRNENSLESIQNYIIQNSTNWKQDRNIINEDNVFFKNMTNNKK